MERDRARSGWVVIVLTALVVLSLASGRSSAGILIASDSYSIGTDPTQGQYTAGVSLNNEPGNLTNLGFANGGYNSGTGGTANFLVSSSGLTSAADGSTSTSSGSAYWLGANESYRSVARNLNTFNEGMSSTYWMSALVKTDGTMTTTDGYVLTGFGNTVAPTPLTTTNFLQGVYVGFANENAVVGGESDLILRYRNTTGMTTADQVLVSGAGGATTNQTYLVVMEVNINYSGSLDQVNYWVNPPDLNSVGDLSGAPVSGSLNTTLSYQGTGDFARLNYASNDWNGATTFFDEQRLGTTLDSIAPPPAVPEPASLVLTVLGGGMAFAGSLWRARRSSR
jgi:hypothetical protein